MKYLLYTLTFLIITACAPVTFQGKDKVLVLAKAEDKCSLVSSKKQYSLLYGTLPLNKIETSSYSSEVPYKIQIRYTLTDRILSLVGGLFLTMTRKTVEMHRCNSRVFVEDAKSAKDKAREENIRALVLYAKEVQASGNSSDLPVINLVNQTTAQGKIVGMTQTHISLESYEKIPVTEDIRDLDWIFLKNGDMLYGKMEKFTPDGIIYSKNGKNKSVDRDKIAKIELNKKRKETELQTGIITKYIEKPSVKEIAMSDVEKIILHPQKELSQYETELKKYLEPEPQTKSEDTSLPANQEEIIPQDREQTPAEKTQE